MARRKGRKGGRKKNSMWKMAKGVVYVGAVAAPMYNAYTQGGGGAAGATSAAKAAAFVDPATGSFSLAHGAQIWTPVAALTIVDLVTSKIGLQQRIARGFSGIGF